MEAMVDRIIYTLNHLHIRGKESLRACIACKNTLADPHARDVGRLSAILSELDKITVSGDDVQHLYGCIQEVEKLLEEVMIHEDQNE